LRRRASEQLFLQDCDALAEFAYESRRIGTRGAWLTIFAPTDYRCGAMKILVIGGGGREHALVWKLRQSAAVEKVWCAPGNGGISDEAECLPIDQKDPAAMADLATRLGADLTLIGPELPLVSGVADEFAHRGMAIFGPSKSAARLEGSKIFAKEFLARHKIPTPHTYGFYDSAPVAMGALSASKWPVVIKADGLCAGKGVLVAQTPGEAAAFLERAMTQREFGEGGARVLLEEALVGEELSLIVITDGERIAPFAPARDHKRVFDGDQGPNTGGMGAYSTNDLLPAELAARIQAEIIEPTIRGMSADGIPYCGFLYFGLMLTASGPQVLEFNCRMGDPETQAIVFRMDFDLASVLAECAAGRLDPSKLKWKEDASACIVMAAHGYPDHPQTGQAIEGLEEAARMGNSKVFHAGTRKEGDTYYTSSGRVLGVTASGRTLAAATSAAYEAVDKIHFAGAHYRSDIGRPSAKQGARNQPQDTQGSTTRGPAKIGFAAGD
jgi:phosphoribosylamine--glycine ligase